MQPITRPIRDPEGYVLKIGVPGKISLENFEDVDVKASGSRFVLTSPRSLRACHKHNVSPIDLVHRSLADFESIYSTGLVSRHEIHQEYSRYERKRRSLLELVRQERKRLISQTKTPRTQPKSRIFPGAKHQLSTHLEEPQTLHEDVKALPVPSMHKTEAQKRLYDFLAEDSKTGSEAKMSEMLGILRALKAPRDNSVSESQKSSTRMLSTTAGSLNLNRTPENRLKHMAKEETTLTQDQAVRKSLLRAAYRRRASSASI